MEKNKIILNLFLKKNINKIYSLLNHWSVCEWEDFFNYTRSNRVLFRVLKELERVDYVDNKELFKKKIKYCKEFLRYGLEIIDKIQEAFQKEGVRFVIFKTIDDFPDLGEDIDVLILEEELPQAKKVLLRLKPHSIEKGIWGSEYAKKLHIKFKNEKWDVEVELYPKFSLKGESYISEKEIIDNSSYVTLYGYKIKIPSQEDSFLLRVIHSIYRHGGLIRITDIVNTIIFLKYNRFDWDKFISKVKRLGLLKGSIIFVSIIKKFIEDKEVKDNLERAFRNIKIISLSNDKLPPFRIPAALLLIAFWEKFLHELYKWRIINVIKLLYVCILHLLVRMIISISYLIGQRKIIKKFGWEV